MTKEQIIRSISEEFKISELESIQFYENVFQYIEGSFRKSKNLNISEFGKFNVIEKTGTGGGKINSVKFSPSKKLATEVNYNYNNLAKILFRDIERNINKERILSLGEENMYREPSVTEAGEVFDRYSEEEKDFIEEQVNLTSANYKGTGLEDLENRVRKIEAFINVIKKFFEDEKLGDTLEKTKTQIVPPQADYVKRLEEDKAKDEQYKASISALESKIKELEAKFKESESKKSEVKPESKTTPKEEKIELPPIDVVPPVIEQKTTEPETATSALLDLGNLVVESDYTEDVKTEKPVESFVTPEIEESKTEELQTAEDVSKPIEESLDAPAIEKKIEERLAEITKAPEQKISHPKDTSTSNIDDLLKTLGLAPVESEDIVEELAAKEIQEEIKPEEVTNEFFIKTEDKPKEEHAPEIQEEKKEETVREKVEKAHSPVVTEPTDEKKLPDTPLAGDLTDSELHQKVDSLIAEFRTESTKQQEEEKQQQEVEEAKQPEEEIIKPIVHQDAEEEQLTTALSSIFNSILTSENIKKEEPKETAKETPIIKEEVKNLHNEIVKNEKSADTVQPVEPAAEDNKETITPSISDIYSSAKSFNDVFEQKAESREEKEHREDMNQIRELHDKDTNGHDLVEANGKELTETNGKDLTETNGQNLVDTNTDTLKDAHASYGPGLTENGTEHDVRTSKIYTNGNPLKPYSNGKNGNSTFNQVLEDNGLQKESKTSIFIILAIIIIALGLLFFAIFNSGIMGKEKNKDSYGLVKVKDVNNEKYFYDNGKDKVFFQTEKGFTIQAGSFTDKESAIEKSKSLADKKINNVRIEELEKDNTTFFRVRIGMFSTLEDAKTYSDKF